MLDLLKPALAGGYAVPSFCVWNAETIAAVHGVAADMRAGNDNTITLTAEGRPGGWAEVIIADAFPGTASTPETPPYRRTARREE
jgi:hypothetical protein